MKALDTIKTLFITVSALFVANQDASEFKVILDDAQQKNEILFDIFYAL